MLQVRKNEAVTNLCKDALGVRLLELGWCTRNYDTMACQAALLAGFAFEQITEAVPQGTGATLEVCYLGLTVGALGFNLCVCTACTFCCIFGQALALRGPEGARSVHSAVHGLQEEQKFIFAQFLLGVLCFLASNFVKMWVFFKIRMAMTISIPLGIFCLIIVYYVVHLLGELLLPEERQVLGSMSAQWSAYERLQDLDEEICSPMVATREPRPGAA